jgi:hypothetical protein
LIRKAAAKKQKIQYWLPLDRGLARRSAIEKVRWPMSLEVRTAVAIAATSISSEPTRV